MPFDQNDLYTVSGGAEVFAAWNPFVTKHDTSSFYSYEQDNLPLFDLEERTHLLWERNGFVFSSLPGLAFVASATIPTNLAVSSNVFTSVSSIVEAMPEVIRQPTVIEVALSGDMGNLNLDNVRFEGGGALEIINRGYAKLEPSATVVTVYDTDTRAGIFRVSSVDFVNIRANTSSLMLSSNTSSLWDGSSLRSFIQQNYRVNNAYGSTYERNKYMSAGVTEFGATQIFEPAAGYKTMSMPFLGMFSTSVKYVDDTTYTTLDASTYYEGSGVPQDATLIQRKSGTINAGCQGLVTANHFKSINISNCNGPLYIRGFIVDGADGTTIPYTHDTEVGISINNCSNVTLENCGSMRASRIGLEINNSKVTIRRGFAAVRNYEPLTSTTRGSAKTYGIKATNSDINILTDNYASGTSYLFNSQMHDVGVYLSNSTLRGGQSRVTYSPNHTVISASYNKVGWEILNSDVDIDGVMEAYNNGIGYQLTSSKIAFDEVVADYNQDTGLVAHSSDIVYGKNKALLGTLTMQSTELPRNMHQVHFVFNGQHMRLSGGSTFRLQRGVYDLPNKFGYSIFLGNHGVEVSGMTQGEMTQEPSIVIDNSYAEITHAKLQTPGTTLLPNFQSKHAVYGAIAKVINGGELQFRGTERAACWMFGPTSFLTQKYVAGVYADNNSTVKVSGPFFAGQFGVDFLATNNSTIKFEPHSNNEGEYDASSWGLSSVENHTSVQLHSTRACVVVDKNSSFIAENLGDYHQTWDRSVIGESVSSSDYFTGTTDGAAMDTSALFKGGSLLFMPNPMDDVGAIADITNDVVVASEIITPGANYGFTTYAQNGVSANYHSGSENIWTITDADWMDKYSRGGYCVRALGGSLVDLTNVHFLPGPVNADDSYYDSSSTVAGCGDLKMWNISNDSILRASYLSVSSTYPSLAGYTGPMAVYLSGNVIHSSSVSYGAFSGTNGTSSLSVLDFYGSGIEVSSGFLSEYYQGWSSKRNATTNTYGASSYENRGPFRLFFSVNPEAKALAYVVGGSASAGDTRPYQHLAQGYSLSGPCSSIDSFALSLFPTLYNESGSLTNTLEASGFYNPSSFTEKVSARVFLDESAANVFANAKHCAFAILGRDKLVNIYRATTAAYGEGYTPTDAGLGIGFKSSNIFDLKRDN